MWKVFNTKNLSCKKLNTLSSEHIGLLNINGIQRRHSGSNSIRLCLFASTLAICSSKTFLLREIINLKRSQNTHFIFSINKTMVWCKKIKTYYKQFDIFFLLSHSPFTLNKVCHAKSHTLLNWTTHAILYFMDYFIFCNKRFKVICYFCVFLFETIRILDFPPTEHYDTEFSRLWVTAIKKVCINRQNLA